MKHLLRAALLALFLLAVAPLPLRADETTRLVQTELRKRHFFFGDINGQSSPDTVEAVRHYQARKGLTVTGVADAETLRSLKLSAPAVTASAAPAGSPNEDPAPAWPDVTLLRSDQAPLISPEERAKMESEQVPMKDLEPVGAPPVAEEGTAADGELPIASEQLQAFIRRYLVDGATNQIDAEMGYYAPQVDYFNYGLQDRTFIRKDVAAYYRHWPRRQFELAGPVRVVSRPDADETTVLFRVKISYSNAKSHKVWEGFSNNQFTVATAAPKPQIVAMKEVLAK